MYTESEVLNSLKVGGWGKDFWRPGTSGWSLKDETT